MTDEFLKSPITLLIFKVLDSSSQPFFATMADVSVPSIIIFSPSVYLTLLNSGLNVAKSLAFITLPNEAF